MQCRQSFVSGDLPTGPRGAPQVDQPGAAQQQLPAQATSIPVVSPATEKTVKHRWQWSSDKQFIVLDAYELKRGDSSAIAVLGDGKLPMTSMTPSDYKCVPPWHAAVCGRVHGL